MSEILPPIAPIGETTASGNSPEYAGFWIRFLASVIDSIVIVLITGPILYAIYGDAYLESENMVMGAADIVISYIFPIVAVILFWIYRAATPGKMVLNLAVVDANTGLNLTVGQSIIRYIGYFVATLPIFLGFIWVAFDGRKQGWHDKMAGSVVVKRRKAR